MFLPSLLLVPMGPDEKAYSMYTGVSEMEGGENRVIFDVRAENFLKLTKEGLTWQSSGYSFTFQSRSCGFNSWLASIDPTGLTPKNQNIKQKQYSNKFYKDF